MITVLIISLSISAGLFILSLIFKVAGKLRLTLPLLYFLAAIVSTFFTDWTGKNESLVFMGLYILIGLVVLSWIVSLIKTIRNKRRESAYQSALNDDIAWQISRARELGIPIDNISIAPDGTVLDAKTGQPLIPQSHYEQTLG